MSAETKAALQDAIAAHIADESDGDLVGAWILVTETTSVEELNDNSSSWYTVVREFQSGIISNGLLHSALYDNS